MDRTFKAHPISIDTMYRSILGRIDGYRGHRVLFVEGDIVGVPFVPLDDHEIRNLMAMAMTLVNGKPTMRVHVSSGADTNAFDQALSRANKKKYLENTFVLVKQADDSEVVCLHLIGMEACPYFEQTTFVWNSFDPEPVVIPINLEGASITGITDDQGYEFTADVHYTVDGDLLIITTDYLEYHFADDGDGEGETCRVLTIEFDNECPAVEVTICDEPEDSDITQ